MYTVVFWSDMIGNWVLHGADTFVNHHAADSFAARKGYDKYAIIPFKDYDKFNKLSYKFLQVLND